jgi:serine/threonine-protein kinase
MERHAGSNRHRGVDVPHDDALRPSERGSGIHPVGGRPTVSPTLVRGSSVGARYTITDLISQGATAFVYAALDEVGQREVAIKVVRYGFGDPSERAIDRLQLESFVYQLAHSRHLPSLLDAGRLPDGSPYIVMDRVQGQTLAERLRQGALSIPAVLEIGRQLMSGLYAAHRHGIVHRDIKPRNLLLEDAHGDELTLKIVDFGICSRERRADPESTVVLGTPSYMSPEQIMGAKLDARSDLYSASVVLYEAVTTRLPFEGGSSSEILTSVLHAPLLPPRVLRESCPVELESVILRGLRRDPDERYPNALAMVAAIEQIADARGLPLGADAFRAPVSMMPPRANTAREAQTERASAMPRAKKR